MQWKWFLGFSSFEWQRGTLQLFAIHLITLLNILEYMQIAIIQTEAADFVKMYICVILQTFGHNCTVLVGYLHDEIIMDKRDIILFVK